MARRRRRRSFRRGRRRRSGGILIFLIMILLGSALYNKFANTLPTRLFDLEGIPVSLGDTLIFAQVAMRLFPIPPSMNGIVLGMFLSSSIAGWLRNKFFDIIGPEPLALGGGPA